MSTSWHSYPKVFNVGHSAIKNLFADPVIVQEKIDGSQFSFGIFDGVLKCRSKNADIVVEAPEPMFNEAVRVAKELQPKLKDDWTYRAEFLAKPKHNVLAYDGVPIKHLILFDINTGHEEYASYATVTKWGALLGLAVVPLLYDGKISNASELRALLERDSILGGTKVEGVIAKNYHRFDERTGKVLMGKMVTEQFKEVKDADWKARNPGGGDLVLAIGERLRTEARWLKAVHHLRDAGKLENSPRDIGALMKMVPEDIKAEEEEAIKAALFSWAWPKIRRKVTAGLPEWYKQRLLDLQFEEGGQE